MTLDYAHAHVGPTCRYSIWVIIAFLLALALPLLVVHFGVSAIIALPRWITLTIPLTVFVINFAASIHLLESPDHILGDGLIASGVFISGFVSLIAMFFV